MTVLRPTTALTGPGSIASLPAWRRVLLILACLIAYAAASAVLNAMPAVFAPRPTGAGR